ncbi:unnamed protein product [Lactuca virosa]|uniref:DUF1308 domain-containing protein n=1 Tax=Lactuca virosa TaxID=75947 RepID=A0AAU9PMA6_9ASTR|nr:unnamed protein product [Lactuca virosa]
MRPPSFSIKAFYILGFELPSLCGVILPDIEACPENFDLGVIRARKPSIGATMIADRIFLIDLRVLGAMVEEAKKRCEAVMSTLETLSLNPSCKHTLLRLTQSELSFLSRVSSNDFTPNSDPSISVNIGHFEAVVHVLQHPDISGVTRVCKTIKFQPTRHNELHKGAHVDIVCTFNGNPVWFIVSDRNPKYISWNTHHESLKNKGLQAKIHLLLEAAHASVALKPTSIIFFFSNGLDRFTLENFLNEFQPVNLESSFSKFDINFSKELEDGWIDVLSRSYQHASVLEIKLDSPPVIKEPFVTNPLVKPSDVKFQGSFGDLVSQMSSPDNENYINFDTTALIAIVSGISNGGTQKLLDTPEDELRSRFKGNTEFVISQVMSEIKDPIHVNICKVMFGRKGIVCESVFEEFKDLVLMCGGVNEKLRAGELLKHVVVVKDSPSTRMMSLPTTRKLALKNKIVFGTGDYWHSPTLTANMGFVRAVSQTGMSLFTFEHRPRALTGLSYSDTRLTCIDVLQSQPNFIPIPWELQIIWLIYITIQSIYRVPRIIIQM